MAITDKAFAVSQSELFDALVNPDTYPHWLIGARRIRSFSADWPQPQSFFEHTVGFGPLTIADTTTVRGIASPRMLELLVRARPLLEATVRFEVEVAPSGCRVRMTETPIGIYKTISVMAQPLIRARNERSLQRLKSFVESVGSPADVVDTAVRTAGHSASKVSPKPSGSRPQRGGD